MAIHTRPPLILASQAGHLQLSESNVSLYLGDSALDDDVTVEESRLFHRQKAFTLQLHRNLTK